MIRDEAIIMSVNLRKRSKLLRTSFDYFSYGFILIMYIDNKLFSGSGADKFYLATQ